MRFGKISNAQTVKNNLSYDQDIFFKYDDISIRSINFSLKLICIDLIDRKAGKLYNVTGSEKSDHLKYITVVSR